MKLLAKLGGIFDSTNKLLVFLAGVVVISIMVVMCYEVLMRYFLHRPPPWAVEVCCYMLFVLTFLGTAWLLKKEGHVRVDIVLTHLNPKTQKFLNIVTSAIGAIVCLVITWYGVETTWKHLQEGIPVIQVLSFPKFILLAFIPLGCFLLSIQFLRHTYSHVMSLRTPSEKERSS